MHSGRHISRLSPRLLASVVCVFALNAPAKADFSAGDLAAVTKACRSTQLSSEDTLNRLRAAGWSSNLSAKQQKQAAKHIAVGLGYQPGKKPRNTASTSRKLRSSLGPFEGSTERTRYGGLVSLLAHEGQWLGYLYVTDTVVRDLKGNLSAHLRGCQMVLEPSNALSALAALGKERKGRPGVKRLPKSIERATGRTYNVLGRIKSMDADTLGFKTSATEYLEINMQYATK